VVAAETSGRCPTIAINASDFKVVNSGEFLRKKWGGNTTFRGRFGKVTMAHK
jgi:hypothetical protein